MYTADLVHLSRETKRAKKGKSSADEVEVDQNLVRQYKCKKFEYSDGKNYSKSERYNGHF